MILKENNGKKGLKNIAIKFLSTISVPCMKFQGEGHGPPLPTPMAVEDLWNGHRNHQL